MVDNDQLTELRNAFSGAEVMVDGGEDYIYLPKLKFTSGGQTLEREALLCPHQHSGYETRLFLSAPVPGRGANWTIHNVCGKAWHACSWNHVSPSLRLSHILANHLAALK